MDDRNDIINQIMGYIGPECGRDLAEKMFDAMRSDDRVFWGGNSLKIKDGVDLIAVAEEVTGS